jgi:hypothetical protein
MDDMRALLAQHNANTVSVFLAQAKCRLNPDLDALDVYRSYGFVVNVTAEAQKMIDAQQELRAG